MHFTCEGKPFDTQDLVFLPVQDPYIHALYVTRDARCVFVFRIGPDGVQATRVRGPELAQMATAHPLPELRQALALDTAP